LEDAQEKLREAEAGAEELRTGLEERKEKIREWGRDHGDLKEEEGKIADQRKELWREDAKLESTVSHAREELKAAERHLASMMDRVSRFPYLRPVETLLMLIPPAVLLLVRRDRILLPVFEISMRSSIGSTSMVSTDRSTSSSKSTTSTPWPSRRLLERGEISLLSLPFHRISLDLLWSSL
jgi:hypothetical protein